MTNGKWHVWVAGLMSLLLIVGVLLGVGVGRKIVRFAYAAQCHGGPECCDPTGCYCGDCRDNGGGCGYPGHECCDPNQCGCINSCNDSGSGSCTLPGCGECNACGCTDCAAGDVPGSTIGGGGSGTSDPECVENGPYGEWGDCKAGCFCRKRDRTWDCKEGGTQRQTCGLNVITGTVFDASTVDDCATYDSQPKAEGVLVTLRALLNQPEQGLTSTFSSLVNVDGLYSFPNMLAPDTYDLSFDETSATWILDSPKLLCDGPMTSIDLRNRKETVTRRIGLNRIYGGWFQSEGGDIYGHDGVTVSIPSTCALAANQAGCNSYTSGGTVYTPLVAVPSYGGTPGSSGMVFSRTGSLSLGGGGLVAPNVVYSEAGYNSVDSGYTGNRYDYEYFFRWFGHLGSTTWDGVGKPSGAVNSLYTHSGSLTWSQSLDAGERIVILNDGDVIVDTNIDVPVGSYLAIISSGGISFASGVTQAEGHYVADSITVESTGDAATDQRFVGEGSFIGWDGVTLRRNRGLTNNGESSELFRARPDLVINAPRGMRNPKITWREVAP